MPRSRIHRVRIRLCKHGSILIKDTLRLFVTITGGKLGVFQFGFAIKGYHLNLEMTVWRGIFVTDAEALSFCCGLLNPIFRSQCPRTSKPVDLLTRNSVWEGMRTRMFDWQYRHFKTSPVSRAFPLEIVTAQVPRQKLWKLAVWFLLCGWWSRLTCWVVL